MSNEQRAHDLAIAIILNRKIDTPVQAYDEYLSMYKTILNEMEKNDFIE